MLKSIQRFGMGLFLMLFAAPAMGDGWTEPGTVTEILVSPSSSVGSTGQYVYFSGLTTDLSCEDTSQIRISNSEQKSLENLLMAAFLSGKRVSCYVAGCDLGPVDGLGNVPKTMRCKIIQ